MTVRRILNTGDATFGGMSRERYDALERDPKLLLTAEEVAAGWFFCGCEWDGMLIHKTYPEAEFCGCNK